VANPQPFPLVAADLRHRNRAASLVALITVNAGIFAAFLFLTYYLQYTPVQTGLAFLPIIGRMFVGSGIAPTFFPAWPDLG
jgi:hypothetical protein